MKENNGHSSPSDALFRIKSEEDKARLAIAEAREKDSARILQEAQAEAKRMKDEQTSEARKQASELKQQRIAQAAAEAEGIRSNTKKEMDELRRRAETKKKDAVKSVAAKIRNYLKTAQ